MTKKGALAQLRAQQVALAFYLQLASAISISAQICISFHANLLSRKSSIDQHFNQRVLYEHLLFISAVIFFPPCRFYLSGETSR